VHDPAGNRRRDSVVGVTLRSPAAVFSPVPSNMLLKHSVLRRCRPAERGGLLGRTEADF